ncbi:MAG: hypothetical protein HC819_11820 [Cyclobacteriaceae bacterium]|nr:hypothetical protein [Cyclobacteriaceae bacterium]
MKNVKFLIFTAFIFSFFIASGQEYSWLMEKEHTDALDWPPELIQKYKNADPDILFIAILNSIGVDGIPTGNDNYGRPIGTAPGNDTIVTTTVRQRYHYCVPACDDPRTDENSTKGGWMKVSVDRGKTWTGGMLRDIVGETQKWGVCCGRSIGAHSDTVFIAVPEGLYTSANRGLSWQAVDVKRGLEYEGRSLYLAPEIRWHTKAGMVVLSHRPAEYRVTDDAKIYISNSLDGGRTWNTAWVTIGGEDNIQWAEPSICPIANSDDFFVFGRQSMDDMPPAQGILQYKNNKWQFEKVKYTDIPWKDGRHDTDGIMYNPQTDRFEAAVSYRSTFPGEEDMSIKLFSIDRKNALQGDNHWRFDGTIHSRQKGYGLGKGEGQHTGGIAVTDTHAFISFGSGTGPELWANSYMVRRTLDTDKLRRYLMSLNGRENLACDEYLSEWSQNWSITRPVTSIHDGRWDNSKSTGVTDGTEAWVIYDFKATRALYDMELFSDSKGEHRIWSWKAEYWNGNTWELIFDEKVFLHHEWARQKLPDINCQKIRMSFTGGIDGVQVPEIRIWGSELQ